MLILVLADRDALILQLIVRGVQVVCVYIR